MGGSRAEHWRLSEPISSMGAWKITLKPLSRKVKQKTQVGTMATGEALITCLGHAVVT